MKMNYRVPAVAGLLLCAHAAAEPVGMGSNPEMSLILDLRYNAYDNDPEGYHLPGFQAAGEAGLADEHGSLNHLEWVITGTLGDHLYGRLTTAIHSHDGSGETELEEAYLETLGLGHGLTLRGGRFYSRLGYLNEQHPHAWDFADAPLIYRGLFGDQLRDDGVQLRWVAPTELFLELGAELTRGESWPNDSSGDNPGKALYAKLGGDVGASHAWQLGVGRWWAAVEEREAALHEHDGGEGGHAFDTREHAHAGEAAAFTGDSAVTAVDFVWKWAPEGNARERNFKFQAEYLVRDEEGEIEMHGSDPLEATTYDGRQSGWYAQAVYQFMPQWRVGLRYDRLNADNRGDDAILAEAGLAEDGHTPERLSAMVDWSHSEYSRLRLQYNQDDSYETGDDQWVIQYVLSLGAHGAHGF